MTQPLPPELPPQMPQPLQYASALPPSPLAMVRAVGLAQRRIMWVILGAMIVTLSFVMGSAITQAIAPRGSAVVEMALGVSLAVVRIAMAVWMMFAIYKLAAALGYGMFGCVMYVIGMLIPCINILILLGINQQATGLLKSHRIRVGLMGARVADLPLDSH